MGSDRAPLPEVEGALAATKAGGCRVILLGDEARLRPELAARGPVPEALSIRHCSQVIGMEDHPAQAVRQKRDASMRVAFDLVRRGEAQAVVSAGNSGAMLACGLFVLGRIKGLDRPGIAVTLPTLIASAHAPEATSQVGQCVLLDTGANVECRPLQLAQFALLGATYAKSRGLAAGAVPRVGLLSNGEEPTKGTPLQRDCHQLLSVAKSPAFEYLGFVEGREIFQGVRQTAEGTSRPAQPGPIDVVVTDGFTGNIVLKTAEGAGRFLADLIRWEVAKSVRNQLGALMMRPALAALKTVVDTERRGGAPLLGVRGVVIICHGRSGPRAITQAIAVAQEQVLAGLLPALSTAIDSHKERFSQAASALRSPPKPDEDVLS